MGDVEGLLPNTEGILVAALKASPPVRALVGARVYTDLPATKTFPLVRLTRFGGAPVFSRPLLLDEADIQVDCWADTKTAAFDLVNAVRAALAALRGVHPLGTVTGVEVGRLAYSPDATFDPAKPKYELDVRVWAKLTARV